jgi:hypothetical protein
MIMNERCYINNRHGKHISPVPNEYRENTDNDIKQAFINVLNNEKEVLIDPLQNIVKNMDIDIASSTIFKKINEEDILSSKIIKIASERNRHKIALEKYLKGQAGNFNIDFFKK